MADDDDSLIREVNEDLRREQFAKLFDRYGIYMLAGAALIVASVGGYKYWQFSSLQASQAAGADYEGALQLIQDGKRAEAAKAFAAIAETGPKGYAVLARLKLAGADASAGKTAQAVAAYDAIVKDGGADKLLAGYAAIRAASLRSGDAHWTEMQNRLNDLAGDGSPWRYSARELLAISAQGAGKTGEARKWYQGLLGDRGTPPAIAARVKVMMAMLAQAELAGAAGNAGDAGKSKKPVRGGGSGAVKSN